MRRRLRALRLLHPYPSALNAALVALIAWVAGADLAGVTLLGGAMLAMQFAIGASNDYVDRELDALGKPWKPIPSGVVPASVGRLTAIGCAVVGLGLVALIGPIEALLWLAMLGCGLVYNLWLKPTPWAWVCFSVAFAILPSYAWFGAASELPPLVGLVVSLAVLAGPLLSIGNGLIDLESDHAARLRTPAALLGRRRSLLAMASLLVAIQLIAWTILGTATTDLGLLTLGAATVAGASGLLLSAGGTRARQLGSNLQFLSVFAMAGAWLLTVA